MTHVACESNLRSVVGSSMHPVVYYAPAAQALSAGIKCRHCIGEQGQAGSFQGLLEFPEVAATMSVYRQEWYVLWHG